MLSFWRRKNNSWSIWNCCYSPCFYSPPPIKLIATI